jgi:hypothetical protein
MFLSKGDYFAKNHIVDKQKLKQQQEPYRNDGTYDIIRCQNTGESVLMADWQVIIIIIIIIIVIDDVFLF